MLADGIVHEIVCRFCDVASRAHTKADNTYSQCFCVLRAKTGTYGKIPNNWQL